MEPVVARYRHKNIIRRFFRGDAAFAKPEVYRYLEAAGYGDDVTGKFFASAPKKMTGPLVEIHNDHIDNPAAQQALMNVTSKTTSQPWSRR